MSFITTGAARDTDFLAVIELDEMTKENFISYYLDNKGEIDRKLETGGAVKFKGVGIDTLDDFQAIVNAISTKFMNYIDGNSPRTKLTGNVYTSTEYDRTKVITMHNELSYSARWPNKLFFSCLQPAVTGGETLLASSREILKNMNKDIVDEIKAKGILYIRNLHGGAGAGPSWQHTFETDNRQQAEAYCRDYGMEFEWKDRNSLQLLQPGKGILRHRITGEEVWFNQIDQFHPYQLGPDLYEAMMTIYDSPEDFPTYVCFGDRTSIPEGMVAEILATISRITIAPIWGKHEFLVLDNELVSHGRNSFTGDRKVLVAMSE